MIPERRLVTPQEVEVIRAVLREARVCVVAAALSETAASLTVGGRCECGCVSVDFGDSQPSGEHHAKPLGDGVGMTAGGGQVGVIVWGNADTITGLEIYDLGAGDRGLNLPVPSSIKPFGKGARRQIETPPALGLP
jgi:hypothetical protein